MYKLVILIKPLAEWDEFEAAWPQFLHLVEKMPGLRREATSRIDKTLFGDLRYSQIHELFFWYHFLRLYLWLKSWGLQPNGSQLALAQLLVVFSTQP